MVTAIVIKLVVQCGRYGSQSCGKKGVVFGDAELNEFEAALYGRSCLVLRVKN